MCELLASPEKTTIADDKPEFSWIVNSDIQNDEQTAYRVLVASSIAKLQQAQGDLNGQIMTIHFGEKLEDGLVDTTDNFKDTQPSDCQYYE